MMTKRRTTYGTMEMPRRLWYKEIEGKGLVGRRRQRWEYNIKTTLKEVLWEIMDRSQVTQKVIEGQDIANTELSFQFHKICLQYLHTPVR